MPEIEKSIFETAVFDVVRDLLMSRQSVCLQGLGVFVVEHEPAKAEETSRSNTDDNEILELTELLPPRDTVTFVPEDTPAA